MRRSNTASALFFGGLATLVLAELVFRNMSSLLNNVPRTAALLGLSVDAERVRLFVLMLLDAMVAAGALMALWASVSVEARPLGRAGVWLATLGLLMYGAYQCGAAALQLGAASRAPVLGMGLFYALLGGVAWHVGQSLTSPHGAMMA